MNVLRQFLTYTGALFLFAGCEKPGCFGDAGEITVQHRSIQPFMRLVLEDNVDVELIQGDESRIELTGPRNIVANIQAVTTGDTLTISNATECRWLRQPNEKVRARIFFRNFNYMDYNGSGNVTNIDTLVLDELYIKSDKGAGTVDLTVKNGYTWTELFIENANLILHGSSEACYTFTNPRARTDMSDFKVKNMDINYAGLADTYIWVTNELYSTVRYKGNVYYKGNPSVKKEEYLSSGRLIHQP